MQPPSRYADDRVSAAPRQTVGGARASAAMQPPSRYADDRVSPQTAGVEEGLLEVVERQLRRLCEGVQQDVREELRRCLWQEQPGACSPDGGTGSPAPLAQLRRPAALASPRPLPPLTPSPPPPETACDASPLAARRAVRPSARLPGALHDSEGPADSDASAPRSPRQMMQRSPSAQAARRAALAARSAVVDAPPAAREESEESSSSESFSPGTPRDIARCDSAASLVSRMTAGATMSERSTYAERVRRNRPSDQSSKSGSGGPRRAQATRWSLKRYRQMKETTASLGCAGRVAFFVRRSEVFDYVIGLVLLSNAVLLGAQANYFAEAKEFSLVPGRGTKTPFTFRVLDVSFCITFMFEMGLRISVFRTDFFRGEAWRWNWFDFIIVWLQVLDEFVKLAFNNALVQERFRSVGVIRVLRLARLARLVRMVRLIPELKAMVYLIYASFNSFVWSIMLILIVMYCCAIYYTEIVTDMVIDAAVPESVYPSLQERWGNMWVSVLSLWMALSGGDDWRNFTDVLRTEKLYVLHVVFFVMFVAFGTLVMLNLVTGVFVESAQRIMKEDKDAELMHIASKLFVATDLDGSSEITFEEFKEQLATGLMEEYVRAIGVGRDELEHLYELLDQDDSGTVNAAEFVKGCLRLRGPARALDLAEMEYQMREKLSDLTYEMRMQMHGMLQALQRLVVEVEAGAPPSPDRRRSVLS